MLKVFLLQRKQHPGCCRASVSGNEVDTVREQFEADKENPPLAKGYPRVAGSIIWARAFLQRLKESVLQFKCMPAFFQSYEAEVVFTNYLNLARQLVAYQDTLFKRWQVGENGIRSDS